MPLRIICDLAVASDAESMLSCDDFWGSTGFDLGTLGLFEHMALIPFCGIICRKKTPVCKYEKGK
jgi:hypothetical protein